MSWNTNHNTSTCTECVALALDQTTGYWLPHNHTQEMRYMVAMKWIHTQQQPLRQFSLARLDLQMVDVEDMHVANQNARIVGIKALHVAHIAYAMHCMSGVTTGIDSLHLAQETAVQEVLMCIHDRYTGILTKLALKSKN